MSIKNKLSNFKYSISSLKSILLLGVLLISYKPVTGQNETTKETVTIPEPLMFDLVRGLGAKKGELEINALADFPLNNFSDRGIEWAPEIEYAVFDNLAIELEFPMTDFELEAFKTAIQWTIGSSKNNKFIHGIQVIGEKYLNDDILELSFLYVPAYRFNAVWSVIGLFGVMTESGSDAASIDNTILLNASVFADLNKHTVVGLELNNSDPTLQKIDDNKMELLILPQVHYEFDIGFSLQFGLGPKFSQSQTNTSAVLRVIKSF